MPDRVNRIDRFARGGAEGGYRPDDPAALPPSYLAAVDDYLRRVDEGEPTGRPWMQQLFPDAPCHTGGLGPLSACPTCHHRVVLRSLPRVPANPKVV